MDGVKTEAVRGGNARVRSAGRDARIRWMQGLFSAAVLCSLAGCSLFIMAGKLFYGDPKIHSAFHTGTGFDLAKSDKTVLVVCSTPAYVQSDLPSVSLEILEGVARRLKRHQVRIIKPDDVLSWLDTKGGVWNDPAELTEKFDVDYIVHIDLRRFDYLEEHSRNMYRGRVDGTLHVYEVRERDGEKIVVNAFSPPEFEWVYPKLRPIPSQRMNPRIFQKRLINRVSMQLAQMLYDHPMSTEPID